MKITCPECQTSYALPDDAIGEDGRRVQCASCGTKWLAFADPEDEAPVADDAFEAAGADADPFAEFDLAGEDGDTAEDEPHDDFHEALSERDEAPTIDGEHAHLDVDRPGEDIESLANGKKRRFGKPSAVAAGLKGRGARIGLAAAAALLVLAVPLREQIVTVVPDLAGLFDVVGLDVNLRGLAFDNVKTTQGYENGVPFLLVEGEIENVAGKAVAVPSMRFAIRTVDRREIYAWTMPSKKGLLAEGERTPFRTRVAAPPAGGVDVQVRFTDTDRRQASLSQ